MAIKESYIVLEPTGEIMIVSRPVKASLAELQQSVGGLIEGISIRLPSIYGRPPLTVEGYVNEEGLLVGLPRNAWFPQFVGPVILGVVSIDDGSFYGFGRVDLIDVLARLDVIRAERVAVLVS